MVHKNSGLEKYLFVGAHPDDIELGAGGTLAKALANGIECHSAVFSDFKNLSAKGQGVTNSQVGEESIAAQLQLGMKRKDIYFYSFPVRNFEDSRQDILQVLIDNFQGNQYTHIFIPNTLDIHQDHKVVATEAIRAFKFSSLFGYELPWNNVHSNINFYNILEQSQVNLKVNSLKLFISQKNRFYFAEDKIMTIMKFRGLQIGAEAAEAFEVIRYVAT
jgi:LmbE family N-acetylglucosaminyl deacetylase